MSVQAEANKMADTFAKAFELFSQCHNGYNSSHYMTDQDIDQLGKNNRTNILTSFHSNYVLIENIETSISTFMAFYRETFPHATVLPKMHIMEDHVVAWLRRWRLGSGLMGEQGAESIHVHIIMKLERILQGIPNEPERLKYIVKEHMLESDPSLTNLRPPLKKRKTQAHSADTNISSDSDKECVHQCLKSGT